MRVIPALLLVAVAACWSAGCAAKKHHSADEYFRMASDELREGSLELAIENYRELLDQYPFSDYTEEAELKIAHTYYLDGSCPEAIAAFSDFQRRHPTSPFLAFSGYLIGECYEQQMRPPDRDQSASQNAHAYYAAVKQQYPESPFAELADEDIDRCRQKLAQHELMVAEFYRQHGNSKAAEFRLLDLVNRFNDTDTAGDALYALGELYRKHDADDRAALAYAALTHHHPDNGLAPRAQKRLEGLAAGKELPGGDPWPILQAQAGRSRTLALAEVVDVPGLEKDQPSTPALGPAIGGGELGPFGGRY